MANLSRTRTVFSFTSPRTIEKIIPEIQVLIDFFNGKEWNTKTQIAFFEKLFASQFYEGSKMPGDAAFAARDRITRAPKALGFVDLNPKIALTKPGAQLLSGKRIHEVIARQLFKFQLPSPFHKIPDDRNFNIRPYLEFLRLVKELDMISKTEIAIFFVQLTHYKKFNETVEAIKKFRNDVTENKGNRRAFIDEVFTREILKIYADDIGAERFKTRESREETLAKFVRTKKSNHFDYADAFMRYLRATQLITFDKKTFRAIVAPARAEEVAYILKNVPRQISNFKTAGEFKNYLYDPTSLPLLTDNRGYLEHHLSKLRVPFNERLTIEQLKDKLEQEEGKIITHAIEKTTISLKEYRQFDDIISVFRKVQLREVPDPPLYFEWNVWRALVMMNYAKDIKGNFTIDLDGVPLNSAVANKPDIEADYGEFKMIVEVTMSSGSKQYEMEGEPVARHYGRAQLSSDIPVYCLFIAPKINENTLAHFFNTNRFNTKAYGGKTKIIPMSLTHFIDFMTIARDKGFTDSQILKSYLDKIIARNATAEDEAVWFQQIENSIPTWVA
ncbi:AlwI family type II restriction endonuclease [Deminuibacter soli]|uniref:AlwI family type II restriction endonuclease n=1 Tax=Deminuibacter soli TaxID=2291815 RepID=A0A3E1NQW6_9BACT|nr:AlwI family type II restriction endonuclease [Deminuibacter soli]RFM30297.1 AlwI family type II restriction endonuclease [Deminuibacter soli]